MQNSKQLSIQGCGVFQSLLLDWGFTRSQLLLVKDALREAGLEIIARFKIEHMLNSCVVCGVSNSIEGRGCRRPSHGSFDNHVLSFFHALPCEEEAFTVEVLFVQGRIERLLSVVLRPQVRRRSNREFHVQSGCLTGRLA